MNNVKNKLSHKLLAAFLSLVMVLSIVPASLIAQAATVNHPDAVTITVVDDITGEPIEGAKVSYVIYDNDVGADVMGDDEVPTDANGEVVILDTEPGDIMISSVTVTHDDYYEYANDTYNQTVTSLQDNFEIKMSSKVISDVTVSGVTTEYDGTEKELVSITGDYDKVTYTYDGNTTDTVPTAKNVGEYEVEVYLEKTVDGVFKTLNKTVTSKITPKDIEITIKKRTVAYNENEQELVEFTGAFEIGDIVTWTVGSNVTTWTVDDSNISDKKIPTAMAIGEYKVSLNVVRENHKELSLSVTSEIVLGEITLGNLSIKANDLTYNGFEQEALTITDQGNYKLMYQFADSEENLQDTAWTEYNNDNKPMVKDAGEYIIFVKAVKENYNDKETEAYPISISVAKAKQSLEFKETVPKEVTVDATDETKNKYDFSAMGDNLSGNDITYSLVDATSNDIATIDVDGKVTVAKAGIVTVKAYRAGNNNYEDVSIYATVVVKVTEDSLVSFDADVEEYILDEAGVVSAKNASKANDDDNGTLSYSIDKKDIGLEIDETTGKVTISDRNKLAKVMGESGSVSLTVTVYKSAGTVTSKEWYDLFGWFNTEITKEVYPEAYDAYTIQIAYAAAPIFDSVCIMGETDPVSGWYNKNYPATITPIDTEKYAIALDVPVDFEDSITITEQGTKTHYVFLKDKVSKQITAGIEVNVKVDTVKPDVNKMKIEFSELSLIERIGQSLGFYNPDVTITFTAEEDATSGIDHFDWTYTKSADASDVNLDSVTNEIAVTVENGVAKAIVKLSADVVEQYRGKISFTATDKANNVSENKAEDYVFVVDEIAPTMSIKYAGAESYVNAVESVGDIHYFNGDVEVELTITEANFYEDEIEINVTRDGQPCNCDIAWGSRDSEDKTVGIFTLNGDGDYVVTVNAKDKSGNESSYTSEIITVDTKAPEISSVYNAIDSDGDGKKDVQNITIKIDEHNFRASDIKVAVEALDISNKPVSVKDIQAYVQNEANWTSNGDIRTLVLESTGENKMLVDAIYKLTINYMDISDNTADTEVTESSLIDHTVPHNVSIDILTDPIEEFIKVITFGFYDKDGVTVRFTAYDENAGVKSFEWNYIKENGASDINRKTDEEETSIEANQDKENLNKFTATITLPNTSEKELRGYLAVYAMDDYGNGKNGENKVTDEGNVIVVDTIAPEVSVDYSNSSRDIDGKAYYNGDVEATITVKEANFYATDVVVKVSEIGAEATTVTPTWTTDENNGDIHYGKFTLTGDGHYIVTVEYTDKSDNFDEKKSIYTSHEITIDTIKPVINVEYDDDIVPVANTIVDNDGNERKYYSKEKTATITIDEHNFDPDEVKFTITAKDVTGADLDIDALNEKKAWSNDGDIHTMTITYPGDANYTFDVAYTDKATNEADYDRIDYFTVDKSKPVNTVVEYSTSVLDTVLESVTFGFYNAKMSVKLTVEDDISEVHSFRYSYLNAGDVSPVNAELIDEEIQAEDIDYSDDRKTATATFEIPKLVLENDNQFNGTVEFTATNRAGLTTDIHKETKRIVVDNIAPTAQVSYNEPINSVGGVSYYDGDISATVVINEANFYADKVQVMVSKDGAEATPVSPVWTDNSTDVHTGTFTLTEDGDYVVTIVYTDYSSNEMTTYTSNQLTIDTDIQAPTYSINGVAKTEIGGSYQDKATVAFNFEDQNFDTNTIKLTRTRFDKVEDVTSKFIKVANNDKGGSGSFTIPSEVGNDGIYVLTIGMTDKAKHTTESQIKFTINRFGSVYEYSDDLVALIRDGGQYVQSVDKDLVITEYNANRLLEGSLKILITRDGEAIDVDYSSNPANINSQVNIGDSGWYQYVYTIKASNFGKDGVYKISLTSAYSADDSKNNESTSVPENSIDGLGNDILDAMNFTVDATAPEIRNIVNLDESIADVDKIIDGKLNVKYTVVDIGGLKSIEILLNGTAIQTLTTEDFVDDAFSYSGSFDISEQDSTTAQKVQFIVTDLAGNVTDTDSEEFLKAHSKDNEDSTYLFFNEVTVSRNFLVRWYADKPLFWGSIIGIIVLTGAIWFFIVAKKKKKEEKK